MSALVSRWKAPLIFAACFALYYLTRTPALDEWDSVQFAMGVKEFNLWTHKPHPPGYPLFIFPGWLAFKFLGTDPNVSLHVVSCLGGALFVAAWFVIVREQFGERFAWLLTGTLVITPVVWMTSTKVLTDSLAAGLFAAMLLYAMRFRANGTERSLFFSALFGAAATGARPQSILLVLAVLISALRVKRASSRIVTTTFAVLVGACLIWLVPTWYSQAGLRADISPWIAYPAQLYTQWTSRLHNPYIYVGAGGFTPYYIAQRIVTHIGGWFGVALGFIQSPAVFVVGLVLTIAAVTGLVKAADPEQRKFWRAHRGWAVLLVVTVFCCLPSDQRYYVPIMPLILVALLRGLARLKTAAALALPALLLAILVPLAIANHRDDPPPLRFVRYMQTLHPPGAREGVLLFLTHSQRHFEYYAPDFRAFEDVPMSSVPDERLAKAAAIYTEEPEATVTRGWRAVQIAEFERSILIYRKHHDIRLYRVTRDVPE